MCVTRGWIEVALIFFTPMVVPVVLLGAEGDFFGLEPLDLERDALVSSATN